MANGSQDPSWSDIMNEFLRKGLGSVHTCMPATVVAYNPALQSATVQPVFRQRVDDVTLNREIPDLAPIPPIANVPVVWPSGLTWSVIGPLAPGDPVTLVFAERSTDEWRATGVPATVPQNARRFDLADAVAIPGGRAFLPGPTGPKLPTAFDPVAVVMATDVPAGIKIGGSVAIDAALKGTIFEVDLLALVTALEVFVTGLTTAVTVPAINALAVTFLPSVTTFKGTTSSGAHRSIKVLIE